MGAISQNINNFGKFNVKEINRNILSKRGVIFVVEIIFEFVRTGNATDAL